jgi:putative transposase
MQFIKGGFSFRLRRELGYLGELWQAGFSEARAYDGQSFSQYREYIAQNPVKAGLVDSPEKYPYCLTYLAKRKKQRGLKPDKLPTSGGTTKVVPWSLYNSGRRIGVWGGLVA